MSIAKKLMTVGGKESAYADDLFSTYLYEGQDSPVSLEESGAFPNTLTQGTMDIKSFQVSPDGSRILMMKNQGYELYTFELSEPFNIEGAGSNTREYCDITDITTTARAIAYANNKLFVVDGTRAVYQFSIDESFSASSISYDNVSATFSQIGMSCTSMRFSADGTYLFLADQSSNDVIYRYTLSTPWDITTASYDHNTTISSGLGNDMTSISFTEDGTKLITLNRFSGVKTTRSYTLSTPWDLTTVGSATDRNVADWFTGTGNNSWDSNFIEPTVMLWSHAQYLYKVRTAEPYDPSTVVDMSIENGVNLDEEGGLVWIKNRTGAQEHVLYDTERGAYNYLSSNITAAEVQGSPSAYNGLTAFTNNGFALGDWGGVTTSGRSFTSWTFRKQPGFFDVVTYTGNGTAGRTVSHNLGSVPGMIIVKSTSNSRDWAVFHRSIGSGNRLNLNKSDAASPAGGYWNSTDPTDTEFTVGSAGDTNFSGETYVAYLFAHDAQDFGTDSDESIIKCGEVGTFDNTVDLGWEAQWIMMKRIDSISDWYMFDSMRGLTYVFNGQATLQANLSSAESNTGYITPTTTGFTKSLTGSYLYVAIRRPHKPAEEFASTDLFDIGGYTGTAGTLDPAIEFPFDTDMFMLKRTNATGDMNVFSRLVEYPTTGGNVALSALVTSSSSAESDTYTFRSSDAKDIAIAQDGADNLNVSGGTYIYYGFRRAPGFFDVVAYTGTGSTRTVSHNLGVAPEFMIIKGRTPAYNWQIYAEPLGNTKKLEFTTAASGVGLWNSTSPTDSVFTVSGNNNVNQSLDPVNKYIAYLFATVPGISKVGSYTGTGSDVDVDCGFTSGARFVLVKRTDATGDWYIWDSVRGIVAGNDPYLLLNSTAAQVTSTDYIDPLSSGFTITSSAPAALNASGGSYLFLAIA
jgi:hypothetical protein